MEMDHLSQFDPLTLPEESMYRLEIDFISFHDECLVYQSYWLFATKAAQKAGRYVAARSSRISAGTTRRRAGRKNPPTPTNVNDTHDTALVELSRKNHPSNRSTRLDTPRPP